MTDYTAAQNACPIHPKDRVLIRDRGSMHNGEIGVVDCIDLETGEVLVKGQECLRFMIYQMEQLEKLV